MKIRNKIKIISKFLVAILFFVLCQNKNEIGIKIPSNIKTVSLAEVLNNPSLYDGKEVILDGIVSSQCVSLCDFVLKDGTNSVTVFPQGFKLPRLEKGKKIKVYARITKGSEQTVFSALGIKIGDK